MYKSDWELQRYQLPNPGFDELPAASAASNWTQLGSSQQVISTLQVTRKESRGEADAFDRAAQVAVSQSISEALNRAKAAAQDTAALKRLTQLQSQLASAEADLKSARSQVARFQRQFAGAVARGAGDDAEAAESQEASALDSVNRAARRVDALRPLLPDAKEQCRKVLRELAAAELRQLDAEYARKHAEVVQSLVDAWKAKRAAVTLGAAANVRLHPAEQKNAVDTLILGELP